MTLTPSLPSIRYLPTPKREMSLNMCQELMPVLIYFTSNLIDYTWCIISTSPSSTLRHRTADEDSIIPPCSAFTSQVFITGTPMNLPQHQYPTQINIFPSLEIISFASSHAFKHGRSLAFHAHIMSNMA